LFLACNCETIAPQHNIYHKNPLQIAIVPSFSVWRANKVQQTTLAFPAEGITFVWNSARRMEKGAEEANREQIGKGFRWRRRRGIPSWGKAASGYQRPKRPQSGGHKGLLISKFTCWDPVGLIGWIKLTFKFLIFFPKLARLSQYFLCEPVVLLFWKCRTNQINNNCMLPK
jgi:hypothetical protein